MIQGVIPFIGNDSVIGNIDLNSQFDTTMSNTGINIPEALTSYATAYYSTQENPTNDLSNNANGWVTAENVSNWALIKSFIIDLGEYELTVGASHTISYQINIPNGIDYNEISYSQHSVYFDLVTESGLYSTSARASKLGFLITKQYDLVVTKYQQYTNKKLQSLSFKVTEVGNES